MTSGKLVNQHETALLCKGLPAADLRLPVQSSWGNFGEKYTTLAFSGISAFTAIRGDSISFPIVTLGLVAAVVSTFTTPGGVLKRDVTLSPVHVLERGDVGRLWSSALFHTDLRHLLLSISANLSDLLAMEKLLGSGRMVLEMLSLTGVTSGLCVALAWIQKAAFKGSRPLYDEGPVGLFGVMVGVDVMVAEMAFNKTCPVPGQIDRRCLWASGLLLSHLFSIAPAGCFRFHMCGALAGILQTFLISPAIGGMLGRPPLNHEPVGPAMEPLHNKHVRRLGAAVQQIHRAAVTAVVFVLSKRARVFLRNHL